MAPPAAGTTLRAPLQRFAAQTLQQHLRELRGGMGKTAPCWCWTTPRASAGLGGVRRIEPGQRGGCRAGSAPAGLHAQAVSVRAGDCRAAAHRGVAGGCPAQITTSSGLYIPQNYDRQFKGLVSVRTALAASLNVPAVRTLVMVTPDAFHRQLGALGLPLRENGDYFGCSLALGSAEVPCCT